MRFPPIALLVTSLVVSPVAAQLSAPPIIVKGTAPSGDVRSMGNGQNAVATLADGSIVALVYKQTSSTSGGHLTLVVSYDTGVTWKNSFALPHNGSHLAHDPESGVLCAGRECDLVHVAWADRAMGGVLHSTWYQAFNTQTKSWVGNPVLVAAANSTATQQAFPKDIAVTPSGHLAIAVGVDAKGGLGMGAWESGLYIRTKGATSFSKLQPMRNGGYGWSRDASIAVVDDVVHCSFKSQKGAGGIAYRSFDIQKMTWQQTAQVHVGPNANGTVGTNGINAGNKSVIAADTKGGIYVLYVTGSGGGLSNNNTMRLAYAAPGKGSLNSDWKDLVVLPHTATLGKNPRKVTWTDPAYPLLQGGDTTYYNYTLAPGFQGAMLVVYSKPWEDFQNKYIQVYQYGLNVPIPTKELAFWLDKEPYIFERIAGVRNTGSVGQAAWTVYGKNDTATNGLAPNGMVRLWAATYTVARSISFGTGCTGWAYPAPRLHGNEQIPQLGYNYKLQLERCRANATLFMAIGWNCQTIDLNFMQAYGCELNINFPIQIAMSVDGAGQLTLPWQIPTNATLNGLVFFTQAFVITPGANPAGALTSNALRIHVSL